MKNNYHGYNASAKYNNKNVCYYNKLILVSLNYMNIYIIFAY